MTLLFILLGSAAVLELSLILPPLWRIRKIVALIGLILVGLIGGALFIYQRNLGGIFLGVLSLYRMCNLLRIVEGRMREGYLRQATRHSSIALIGVQIVLLLAWWAWARWHTNGHVIWALITIVQVVGSMVLCAAAIRRIRHTHWPLRRGHFSDDELPSITVAVPARNETDDLYACLQSIVGSDYPKLEIIALDDCSQNKRTPEIIRQFAHEGVRFVQGIEPDASWLAKNQAYDQLVKEASGAYIVFCGVDVRFAPHSIRDLVSTALQRDKQMISVLPQRAPAAYGHASLLQAMRYWWELAPPRRLFHRPPVLSTCWLIQTKALKTAGGFAAVARAIVPEAHFARQLIASDSYSFLRADEGLGIQSVKTIRDQRDTAVRMRYPQVRRRIEQVALVSLLEIGFLLLPFIVSLSGFWLPVGMTAQVLATVACLLLTVTYELIVLSTHVNSWWFGLFAQPLAVITDVALLHYSMVRYEFSTVTWKGRNVCLPAMYVIPSLPSPEQK